MPTASPSTAGSRPRTGGSHEGSGVHDEGQHKGDPPNRRTLDLADADGRYLTLVASSSTACCHGRPATIRSALYARVPGKEHRSSGTEPIPEPAQSYQFRTSTESRNCHIVPP